MKPSSVESCREELLNRLKNAFPPHQIVQICDVLREDTTMFDDEVCDVRDAFAGRCWIDVTQREVLNNPTCLGYFSRLSIRTYMPSIFMTILDACTPSDNLINSCFFSLTAPSSGQIDESDSDFWQRMGVFNTSQRQSIRAWMQSISLLRPDLDKGIESLRQRSIDSFIGEQYDSDPKSIAALLQFEKDYAGKYLESNAHDNIYESKKM